MTTIIADFRLGVMVADSNISDGNRVWVGRKVFRCKGALLGFAGDVNEAAEFMAWWKRGCTGRKPAFSKSEALVLTPEKISKTLKVGEFTRARIVGTQGHDLVAVPV